MTCPRQVTPLVPMLQFSRLVNLGLPAVVSATSIQNSSNVGLKIFNIDFLSCLFKLSGFDAKCHSLESQPQLDRHY